MTYDKDTQKINRAIDKWFSEHAQAINIFTAEELKEHDKIVADQVRKEAADRAVSWVNANLRDKHEPIMSKKLEEDELRAAILGDSAPVSTDSEKLAIAVNALEEIKTLGTHSTLSGRTTTGERIDSKTIINTYGIKARDALKEIQG